MRKKEIFTMNIDYNLVFQFVSMLITILSGVWFFATKLSTLNTRIDKLEAKLETLSSVDQNCRTGRVQLWEAVNEERMKVAGLEARVNAQEKK